MQYLANYINLYLQDKIYAKLVSKYIYLHIFKRGIYMKAYQVVEPGKPLELNEFDAPKPQGEEILVKTIACGVCHADVHIHEGAFDLGGG